MDFQLTATNSQGSFDVTDATSAAITTLRYENWFSSTASATVDGRTVQIKTRNIWWSNFDILIDGADQGDLTFNWKGHIIIKLTTHTGEIHLFLLKAKGFWQQHFVLEDAVGQMVLEMHPTFKWQKMHYNYAVQFPENTDSPFDRQVLLLACGYGANLYMTMMTASAASSVTVIAATASGRHLI